MLGLFFFKSIEVILNYIQHPSPKFKTKPKMLDPVGSISTFNLSIQLAQFNRYSGP